MYKHACEGLEPIRLSNPIRKATLDGIAKVKGNVGNSKDPLLPCHLKKMSGVVNVNDVWEFVTFVCVLVLFRTLLRISHAVASGHSLRRSDVVFNSKGCLLAVRSSKTSPKGGEIQYLPVMYASDKDICAVSWLKRFLRAHPMGREDQLFSIQGRKLTYKVFSDRLNKLLAKSQIHGDFASHSLRRGGATHMSMIDCTVMEIKSRGNWKSDCVYRYIRQPMSHKIKVEKKVSSSV